MGMHLLLSPAASHSGWEDHMQSDQFHYIHHAKFECTSRVCSAIYSCIPTEQTALLGCADPPTICAALHAGHCAFLRSPSAHTLASVLLLLLLLLLTGYEMCASCLWPMRGNARRRHPKATTVLLRCRWTTGLGHSGTAWLARAPTAVTRVTTTYVSLRQ